MSIPLSVGFGTVKDLCTDLGVEPTEVQGIEIGPMRIRLTVYRRDRQGKIVVAGDEVVTQSYVIKVRGPGDGDYCSRHDEGCGCA